MRNKLGFWLCVTFRVIVVLVRRIMWSVSAQAMGYQVMNHTGEQCSASVTFTLSSKDGMGRGGNGCAIAGFKRFFCLRREHVSESVSVHKRIDVQAN